MQPMIERELAALGGHSACVVVRMGNDAPKTLVSLGPDQVFPAAGLARLPILIEVARQVEFAQLSWETRYTVPDAIRVPGAGGLADLSPSLRLTLYDLAYLMITSSDNTASNMLLDLVGMEAVNSTMDNLGLISTRLECRFLDFEARRSGRDNWTAAADMALLFSFFCTELLPGKATMLRLLLRQNDNALLSAYWAADVPFAHKTGGMAGIVHDAGILYPPATPATPLIAVALTAEQSDVPLTTLTLARIGRMVYNGA